MKVKVWIVLVLITLLGSSVYFVSRKDEKEKRRSDFFRNDLKNLNTTDGEKF
jgi:hypothetical protein